MKLPEGLMPTSCSVCKRDKAKGSRRPLGTRENMGEHGKSVSACPDGQRLHGSRCAF